MQPQTKSQFGWSALGIIIVSSLAWVFSDVNALFISLANLFLGDYGQIGNSDLVRLAVFLLDLVILLIIFVVAPSRRSFFRLTSRLAKFAKNKITRNYALLKAKHPIRTPLIRIREKLGKIFIIPFLREHLGQIERRPLIYGLYTSIELDIITILVIEEFYLYGARTQGRSRGYELAGDVLNKLRQWGNDVNSRMVLEALSMLHALDLITIWAEFGSVHASIPFMKTKTAKVTAGVVKFLKQLGLESSEIQRDHLRKLVTALLWNRNDIAVQSINDLLNSISWEDLEPDIRGSRSAFEQVKEKLI